MSHFCRKGFLISWNRQMMKINNEKLNRRCSRKYAMMRGEEKSEEKQKENLIPASFSPAFRDLWEFRSLTPHTFFEPKGSYDRCTVLTRKRWMLSEEKRIGLSSQKMRERGKREKSLWNCLSFVHVTLRSVLHSNSENEKSERERELDYDVP